MCYFVIIKDKIDGLDYITKCDNDEELANLLLHIDKEKYRVDDINFNYTRWTDNYKDFCKKDKNLETG